MSTEAMVPHRYPALDALRGVAALGVLFYHLKNVGRASLDEWPVFSFASGYLAVDLFFVLSGFVICHAYEVKLEGALTFRDFMIARFIRLQPVIAVGTLIGFALALIRRANGMEGAPGVLSIATGLPANLLLLPNILVPWGIFLFNPPAWSVFYELLANALYALALRHKPQKRLLLRAARIRISIPIAICAVGYAGILATLRFSGSLDHGVVLQDWPYALARIAFSFTLGILLCRSRTHWQKYVCQVPAIWLLVACLGLLAPEFTGSKRILYDLAFATIASPLLVMLGAGCSSGRRGGGASEWLGMISYPLYAVHAPIKHLVAALFPAGHAALPFLIAAMAIGVAWGTAKIDPSLRRWLADRIQRTLPKQGISLPLGHRPSGGV